MEILIIDDDPTSLKLAGEVLQTGGHVVLLATSAERALCTLKAAPPDLILTDLCLPGLDGLAVARLCRAQPATEGIPIIALTGFSEAFGKAEALAAGCDAYLIKPVNTRTVLHLIEDTVAAKAKHGKAIP